MFYGFILFLIYFGIITFVWSLKIKKEHKKILATVLILFFLFRPKIFIIYSDDFVTDNNIIDNKIEITHSYITGSRFRDYILFTVDHEGSDIDTLSIGFQGNQKPLGPNIDMIINNVSVSRNGVKYKTIRMVEQNKSKDYWWYVNSNGREKSFIEKEEPGTIDKDDKEGLERYRMTLQKGDVGLVNFYIHLQSGFFTVLKENSKVKINLTIVDENGDESTHDVIYKIENVKKKVEIWSALFLNMDIILNH